MFRWLSYALQQAPEASFGLISLLDSIRVRQHKRLSPALAEAVGASKAVLEPIEKGTDEIRSLGAMG